MKRRLFFSVTLLLLAMLWTTGCGRQPTAVAPPDEAQSAETREAQETASAATGAATPAPESETEEATMTPIPTPEATEVEPPAGAEELVRLAREDLAGQLGIASQAVRLVSVEAVEWPDTSLGCPQPGMMYAQVITPGFLVVLKGKGQAYEYHTDRGDQVILCQSEAGGEKLTPPVSPPGPIKFEPPSGAEPPAGAEEVVRLAREDLAGRLGLAPEAIRLVSAQAMSWPDASLGCPQPGMMYAQVITPGFRVVLEAEGREYEYHTDVGRFVVLCEE